MSGWSSTGLKLEDGKVIGASMRSVAALNAYFEDELQDCKENNFRASLHLKATMMKISDPKLFLLSQNILVSLLTQEALTSSLGSSAVYQPRSSVFIRPRGSVFQGQPATPSSTPGSGGLPSPSPRTSSCTPLSWSPAAPPCRTLPSTRRGP